VIRIGTRGSELALWQAHFLQAELKNNGFESELKIIKTKGDQIQHLSFDKIEGKGFFTKELEDALLNNEVDLAVHSMKDMPTSQPEGLCLAGVSYREDPSDTLLILKSKVDASQDFKLALGAKVGTSSARRKSQILDFRPDVKCDDIRGNVPTRINKLREGIFDAILLAKAGLNRLNLDLSDLEVVNLHPKEFIPAPAQGVLAYQCRLDDFKTRKIVAALHHGEVSACTNVERQVLKLLGGGCHMPVGVYCEKDNNGNYHAFAAFSTAFGNPLKRSQLSYSTHEGLAEEIFQLIKN
jgi:hydroxymethylbilane synthase